MSPAPNADAIGPLRGDMRELSGYIETLTRAVEESTTRGNTQTIVHKSSMGGFVAGIAVACCIGSFFFTMFVARSLNNDIRDLRQDTQDQLRDQKAWTEVLRGKVSTIEGKIQPMGAKP